MQTMTTRQPKIPAEVGPVLESGAIADAVIAAIRRLNSNVRTMDRGSYIRVYVPGKCLVTRQAIEAQLGRPMRFPGELECHMPSFKGTLQMSENDAE